MTALQPSIDAGVMERNLPRYTTYPTPAWFHDGVGAAEFDAWAATLRPGTRMAVRLHVPFCRQICWFCACRTQGVRRTHEVTEYLDALLAEIDRTAGRLGSGAVVTSVHWGGGTPTVLTPAEIACLAGRLRDRLPLAADAEFSVEADPRGLDADRLDALAAAGVTRMTLGVQDFASSVQRAIGRIQAAPETASVIAAARTRGIREIGVDLLYGLPRQDTASLAATLAVVIAMRPERITLSGYSHVPWMAKRQRMIAESSLPRAAARLDLCRLAAGMIAASGYVAAGADRFALPGMRRTDPPEVAIGLGTASISRFPQGYVQNAPRTGDYLARITGGAGAGSRGIALGLEDRIRGRAIEMLLRDFRIDIAALRTEFGDFARVLTPSLNEAVVRFGGLVERREDVLEIVEDGVILARAVACCFDAGGIQILRPEPTL